MESSACRQCNGALPAGVADLFCPACALRRALIVGEPSSTGAQGGLGSRLRRWLRRWNPLVSAERPSSFAQVSRTPRSKGASGLLTAVPSPGDIIEDYEILEKIGGNMALVFRARHRLLDKMVALKLLPAEWIADSSRLARFQRELRIMGQLEHPNLVTAADARRVDAWHLVAMEWIDGLDLMQLLRRHGPIPVPAACEAARQAALGLHFAHQHGLIHRDIKPSNLMLSRSGTVKVIDLGLALARQENAVQLTQTGLVLGTISYCAPEQFRDASGVDIRADIYSLGCTLYHLLVGRAPFGQRSGFAEVVQAHLHEPFPSLTAARPDVPFALALVLERMTVKEREARYATPLEVAEALEPHASGADLGSLIPAKSAVEATGDGAGRPVGRAGQASERREDPLVASPWRWSIAVLIILLAVAGGVVLGMSLRHSEPSVVKPAPIELSISTATPGMPVVLILDTRAADGVYDPDVRERGGDNSTEIQRAIEDDNMIPGQRRLYSMPILAGWHKEADLIALRPTLIIIHRSAFHHSYNSVFHFGATNQFIHPSEDYRWKFLYNDVSDDRLITLMGYVGSKLPQCKFLVYSRGTDPNWLRDEYRTNWVTVHVEGRFPELKDRVITMVIPNRNKGSFRDQKTRDLLKSILKQIVSPSDKYKPEQGKARE